MHQKLESRHTRPSVKEFSLKVALASTSVLALPTYRALKNSSHQLAAIITKSEKQSGRGLKIEESAFIASLGGEKVIRIKDQQELVSALKQEKVDLVVTVSFGMLVKEDALNLPTSGWINLHFSLLPKYRGAAPVQRAILAGEKKTGVSVFQLDKGMDTGALYTSKSIEMGEKSSGELLNELAEIGSQELLRAIEMIEKGVAPTPQMGEASLAPKIHSEETALDFTASVDVVVRKVRAFSPKPGAWSKLWGGRVKILEAERSNLPSKKPGEILSVNPLIISTSDGAITIKMVQEAGKKVMNAQDWVRGARLAIGEFFE
jgi:methionyl-tRNA formyltransferase